MAKNEALDRCKDLESFWNKRNQAFQKWYRLIQMVDELAQEDMESFVGNDPRSAFNLLIQMLNQKISHRFDPKDITMDLIEPAARVSNLFGVAWDDVYHNYRLQGRYWLRTLISFLLSTGWYSVFATITLDGSKCVSEIWNPATVFPAWDDQLTECAHNFTIGPGVAKRLAERNKWNIKISGSRTRIYDYWAMVGSDVVNAITVDTTLVKPLTVETRFSRIPIFVGPVGGLPDTGEITQNAEEWKGEIGQSFVATNQNIYKYWNKWWTFTLQLLRDTAQARTYEKSRGEKIVKPEEWNKRGSHFTMAPEESVGYIEPPPLPIELRSAQLDMEAMMQRGGPSWSLYGDVRQQISSYVMAQVAASAHQLIGPFHQGIVDCISDIDNLWLDMIRKQGYKPYGMDLPKEIPESLRLITDYEVRVPGDFIQRATAARMLDPNFELSPQRIMSEFFPEITNPNEEMAKIRAAKAERNPIMAIITLVESCREQAKILDKAGDKVGARLYEKAANQAESMLDLAKKEQPPATGAPIGTMTAGAPPATSLENPPMAGIGGA